MDGSIKCKHCQSMLVHAPDNTPQARQAYLPPMWTSITSMVLGIIVVLALIGEDFWDKDSLKAGFMVGLAAIIFAAFSLIKKHRGKGMAIAGLITGIIGVLCVLGY